MQSTTRTVNAIGLAEIHKFLAQNHRLGGDHFTDSMIRAWAADAEFSLSEGNDASIELKSSDSVSGQTMTYCVSDEGIDTEMTQMFEVIDNDEFVDVAVHGVNEACFTISKEFREWGCAPEDNAPTWDFLCGKLGDTDAESVISKLNKACADAGVRL